MVATYNFGSVYNLIDPVSLETMVIEVSGIKPH